MRTNRLLMGLLAIVALAGCASRPINEPITQFESQDFQAFLREFGGAPAK